MQSLPQVRQKRASGRNANAGRVVRYTMQTSQFHVIWRTETRDNDVLFPL